MHRASLTLPHSLCPWTAGEKREAGLRNATAHDTPRHGAAQAFPGAPRDWCASHPSHPCMPLQGSPVPISGCQHRAIPVTCGSEIGGSSFREARNTIILTFDAVGRRGSATKFPDAGDRRHLRDTRGPYIFGLSGWSALFRDKSPRQSRWLANPSSIRQQVHTRQVPGRDPADCGTFLRLTLGPPCDLGNFCVALATAVRCAPRPLWRYGPAEGYCHWSASVLCLLSRVSIVRPILASAPSDDWQVWLRGVQAFGWHARAAPGLSDGVATQHTCRPLRLTPTLAPTWMLGILF